jgi:non-specific serine/threonine protein kinase/serine/threonine-protein kinase
VLEAPFVIVAAAAAPSDAWRSRFPLRLALRLSAHHNASMTNSDASDGPRHPRDGGADGTAGEGSRLFGSLYAAPGSHTGDMVGPYKLIEVIGEGGFGEVWLAERREPMLQRVAVKIIKPGMDSRAVIARFEQERQALAVMDHPNVARVFDGGVTAAGTPYFVMEFVDGEPITAFADRKRLKLRERLELFIPVCEAVQHAHHKGLIHRDLKPGNVLVVEIEGKAVPKVIDFGVAKAIAGEQWTNTAHTQSGVVIGTPLYMSPEQVAGEIDIDTRTDVYSLGVMLYELLAGETPFDARSMRKAAMAEIQRIIRDETPPKPSARMAQFAGDRTTTVADARSATSDRITNELRRELDWIPLMALRKERDRRYESPQALADDLRRYLDGRPLRAAPESRAYLARKFVRRNKVPMTAAATVFVALAAGLSVALWQRSEAIRAKESEVEQRARADERADAALKAEKAEKARADELKRVSEFQSQMLSQIDTTKAGVDLMKDVRTRFAAALEKAGVPEQERVARTDAFTRELGRVNSTDAAAALIDRTLLRPAITTIGERFSDQPLVDAQLRHALAELYRRIGLNEAAVPLQESALATRRRMLGDEHPDTLDSIGGMSVLLRELGRLLEAEPFHREALERSRRVRGAEHPETAIAISNIGGLLRAKGEFAAAEPFYREALEKLKRALGDDHAETLRSINNMGVLLAEQGRLAEAEPYYREALGRMRRTLGEEDQQTITAISNMGYLLFSQGKAEQAEALLREALEKSRRTLGEEHPDTLLAVSNMGAMLLDEGRLAEAEPHLREAVAIRRRTLGVEHPDTLLALGNLGILFLDQRNFADAEPPLREALEIRRRTLGEEHVDTLIAIGNLGSMLRDAGRLAEAEPLHREVLEKRRRVLGEEHPHTLVSLGNIGVLLQRQGSHAEAEPFLLESFEKRARALGDRHPLTVAAIGALADLYTAWNQAEPGQGHDGRAAEWRAKRDEMQSE